MTLPGIPNQRSPKEAWETAVFAFLSSRLLACLFVYMGHLNRSPVFDPKAWDGTSNWWLNPWTTYDSYYYSVIASHGYSLANKTAAFFPLYSLLLKLGGAHENGMAAVGVLVSNFSFLFALFLFYRLTEIDFGPEVSKKALWLLAFFPTSFFFSAVYTESFFLFLILASFYGARQGQWGVAGICGLLASLTRNPGVLIFLALALEYFQSMNYDVKRLKISKLFFISLPLVGFCAVQAFLWYHLGVPMAGVAIQHSFYRSPGWPWVPVWKDLFGLFTYLDFDIVPFINLVVIALTGFFLVRFRQQIRPSYGFLLIGLLLMNLIYFIRVPPYTTSTSRYILTAFPFFQFFALLVESERFKRFVRPLTGIYVYTFFMLSYMFGLKSFVG